MRAHDGSVIAGRQRLCSPAAPAPAAPAPAAAARGGVVQASWSSSDVPVEMTWPQHAPRRRHGVTIRPVELRPTSETQTKQNVRHEKFTLRTFKTFKIVKFFFSN